MERPASSTASRETSVQIPRVLLPSGERLGFISPMPVMAAARLRVTIQFWALENRNLGKRPGWFQSLVHGIYLEPEGLERTYSQKWRGDGHASDENRSGSVLYLDLGGTEVNRA
jgi:hypothetical protein